MTASSMLRKSASGSQGGFISSRGISADIRKPGYHYAVCRMASATRALQKEAAATAENVRNRLIVTGADCHPAWIEKIRTRYLYRGRNRGHLRRNCSKSAAGAHCPARNAKRKPHSFAAKSVATVASRSCPSRIPSPPGASPTECPFAGRTGCRSTPHAPEQAVGRHWPSEKQVAAMAR